MNLLGYMLALVLALGPATPTKQEGQELIGTQVLEWSELHFIGPPLKLSELRGKVVLVRWWSEACPMCSSALPSLARLYDQHEREGLVVVGIYHPKPARGFSAIDVESIKKTAAQLGAHFPIAIDGDWAVLRRWWLSGGHGKRDYTSASFLIDRRGVIRWIHKGGELRPSTDHSKSYDHDYQELTQMVTDLLREPG